MKRNRTRRLPRAGVWRALVFGGVAVTKVGRRGGSLIRKSVERGTEQRAEGRRAWESSRCRTRSRVPSVRSVRRRQRRAQLRLGAAAAPKWEGVLHGPGIEPGPPAWQARILPLNHPCTDGKRQQKLAQRSSPPAAVHWSPPAVGLRPIGASTRGCPDGASRRGGSRHVEGPEARRGGRAEGERRTRPILRFLCRPGPRDWPPGSPGEGAAVARARMLMWAGELWRAFVSADPGHRSKVFCVCFCLFLCLYVCFGGAGFFFPTRPAFSLVSAAGGCGGGGVNERGRRWGTGLAAAACGSETQTKSVGAPLLRSDPPHRLALGVRPHGLVGRLECEKGAEERCGRAAAG